MQDPIVEWVYVVASEHGTEKVTLPTERQGRQSKIVSGRTFTLMNYDKIDWMKLVLVLATKSGTSVISPI